MTPAERLGQQLMDLKRQSSLTAGAGGRLVDEALSQETQRRQCGELARAAGAVAFAAGMLSRVTEERFGTYLEQTLADKIDALQKAITECPSLTNRCENSTEATSPAASLPGG